MYLSISEAQPNFKLQSRLKLVQAERRDKCICSFPYFIHCGAQIVLRPVVYLCIVNVLLYHNFNFVLVVHAWHSPASSSLLSLNHNFFPIHDVDTLKTLGVGDAATVEIVDEF